MHGTWETTTTHNSAALKARCNVATTQRARERVEKGEQRGLQSLKLPRTLCLRLSACSTCHPHICALKLAMAYTANPFPAHVLSWSWESFYNHENLVTQQDFFSIVVEEKAKHNITFTVSTVPKCTIQSSKFHILMQHISGTFRLAKQKLSTH